MAAFLESLVNRAPGRVERPRSSRPLTGLQNPTGLAVDNAGTVYVTDNNDNRVLQLPAK
jgi:hypothetical protein